MKYGWQAEQVLTVIAFLVERVLMTLPQAQVIVASVYSGWISFFIFLNLSKEIKTIILPKRALLCQLLCDIILLSWTKILKKKALIAVLMSLF